MLKKPNRSSDTRLFPAADFWHVAPRSRQIPARFKEWSHFCVLGDDFDLLLNFSLIARGRASPRIIPRMILLFSEADGSWDGDVETFDLDETEIFEGSSNAAFGNNSVRFADRRYNIDAALSKRDVRITLDLFPSAQPLVAENVRLSGSDIFRWMVVPRLRAKGAVTVSGRLYSVVDAPAYHDRNSGCFEWGGAYAWEWATILPPGADLPWCLVYSRMLDRHRGTTLSQSLLLWRGEALARKFYARDLSISHHGMFRRERLFRLPRAASLAMPGTAADVPKQILISARGYGDELMLRMSLDDYAQIVVPNDHWPGFTALCEVKGRAEVNGRIGGDRLAFEGRVQAEFNNAAT
jgi:hypothetical protein